MQEKALRTNKYTDNLAQRPDSGKVANVLLGRA